MSRRRFSIPEALVLTGDEITHADAMQESLRASGMPEDVARLIAIRDTLRRSLDRKDGA